LIEDRGARDVGGHQVRRELDARERHVEGLREAARDQRLREPRIVLDQDVAVGEEAEQHELERLPLADDGALDLGEDAVRLRTCLVDGAQIASSWSTTTPSSSTVGPLAIRAAGGCASGRTASQALPPTSPRARSGSVWSSTPYRERRRCSAMSRRSGRR